MKHKSANIAINARFFFKSSISSDWDRSRSKVIHFIHGNHLISNESIKYNIILEFDVLDLAGVINPNSRLAGDILSRVELYILYICIVGQMVGPSVQPLWT
jgi:hypothetical protein